jgi:hypothetical protein
MGFVADVVGGVADAVGSVVGGVVDAVGSVAQALGPIGTMAAMYFGMPAFAPSGFAALGAPSILAGTGSTLTGAGMLTGGLGTSIGGSLLSTAGGLGVSSAFSGANSFINGLGGFTSSVPNATSSFGSILDSAGNFAKNLVSGETGGMPTGTGGGGLSKYTNLIKTGMSIYDAFNNTSTGQDPNAARDAADPYSQFRADASTKLNQLMNNPNMVYGMPGYQFAQEEQAKGIQRQAAASGQSISGNTLASLQKQNAAVAQDWFNNYVGQLSTQAGVNQSPAVGQAAFTNAANMQSLAAKNKKDQQLEAVLGLGGALGGFFG